MSQFDQPGQHVGRDLYNIGRDFIIHSPPPKGFPQVWLFLWRHKSVLLGVALLCGIALYPLFPPTVDLIAENVSSSPFGLLILAVLGISCFEMVPLLFGAVFGPWIGFFVGSSGVLLSGLLANALAAHDYPTKVHASFDLLSGQAFWIWFLVVYSLLIGASAWFTGFRTRGKRARSLSVRGGISLLIAVGIYLLIALGSSQVALSFSALYPLLAVSDQTQVLGGATVLLAVLFVPAGLLLLALPPVIRHTARIRNWIRAHRWPRYGTLVVVLIALALPPVYEWGDMQTPSTHLRGQDFPLDISLASCDTCDPLYLQITLEDIKLDQNTSIWHISLTNPAVCREIAFLPQSIVIHDAFSTVYQPITFSGLTLLLAQGASQELYLRYQIVPKSTHHLWLDLSLHVTSCPGDKSVDEEVQGSQMLLFQ